MPAATRPAKWAMSAITVAPTSSAIARKGAKSIARQLLDLIDELAAAVVAPAGQPLGVLVGEHRALRLEHRLADDVLRGDELEVVPLPLRFPADGREDLRIGPFECGGHLSRYLPLTCGSRCS